MPELYFNDANLLPESREEEQSAETVLNIMLAGKNDRHGDVHLALFLPCAHVQGGADQSGRRHNAADQAYPE